MWFNPWRRLMDRLDRIDRGLATLFEMMGATMHNLDEVLATVEANSTKVGSLIALVDGLKAAVADALAHVGLSAEEQAKVDAVFNAVTAESTKVQAALDANIPTPAPSEQPPQPTSAPA